MAIRSGISSISGILILVAFVFLLLATISSPVVNVFNLGSTNSHHYGIWGYCNTSGNDCSKATYPYTLSNLDKNGGWILAPSTRDKLAKIFIVAPIALGLTFITFIITFIGIFAGSPTVIIALVANIIAFIATTLIAVIVIVVFHPHVAWTGWILIGAAAALLVSAVFLIVAVRIERGNDTDDDSISEKNPDLTQFDDKFESLTAPGFVGPSKFGNDDAASSISKDYEFKVKSNQMARTTSNSSSFASSPQVAKDFTVPDKPSTAGYAKNSSGSLSIYEDANVNLKNGPSTPVATRQQIAPNYVPTQASPTNDRPPPRAQYPPGSSQRPPPGNYIPVGARRQNNAPYPSGGNFGPPYRNLSVFEHHPEVEGHRPFTELDDDEPQGNPAEIDSDADSDFTSVSQRAPNPSYYPQSTGQGYYPVSQGQYSRPTPASAPYQPRQQFQNTAQPNPYYAPTQFQSVPQPVPQQTYYNVPPPGPRRPQNTVSDNILSNHPDFSFGPGGVRRNKGFVPMAKRANGPSGYGSTPLNQRGKRGGPYDVLS